MITLAPAPFATNARIKVNTSRGNAVGGPDGHLALMRGFKSQGAMHAHRYNGQPDGTNSAPPRCAGEMPISMSIPATAVYVVWSYDTPIAWVDEDGTVTVPDVSYSVTTTQHQGRCRAWLGAAVEGTSTHAVHILRGYRAA